MRVRNLLLTALVAWIILASLSHGLGVLAYIGIQACTTGVFMLFFLIVEKAYE